MKNLFLLIASVLIIMTTNAQQNDLAYLSSNEIAHFLTNERSISKPYSAYNNKITSNGSSKTIKALEKEILEYHLKNETIYDISEKATYRVVFRKKLGKAIVNYDNDGAIISSTEKYKNIKIPYQLSVFIAKTYPKWSIENTIQTIHYTNKEGKREQYFVQIKQGKTKKKLKFNGNFKLAY